MRCVIRSTNGLYWNMNWIIHQTSRTHVSIYLVLSWLLFVYYAVLYSGLHFFLLSSFPFFSLIISPSSVRFHRRYKRERRGGTNSCRRTTQTRTYVEDRWRQKRRCKHCTVVIQLVWGYELNDCTSTTMARKNIIIILIIYLLFYLYVPSSHLPPRSHLIPSQSHLLYDTIPVVCIVFPFDHYPIPSIGCVFILPSRFPSIAILPGGW